KRLAGHRVRGGHAPKPPANGEAPSKPFLLALETQISPRPAPDLVLDRFLCLPFPQGVQPPQFLSHRPAWARRRLVGRAPRRSPLRHHVVHPCRQPRNRSQRPLPPPPRPPPQRTQAAAGFFLQALQTGPATHNRATASRSGVLVR